MERRKCKLPAVCSTSVDRGAARTLLIPATSAHMTCPVHNTLFTHPS